MLERLGHASVTPCCAYCNMKSDCRFRLFFCRRSPRARQRCSRTLSRGCVALGDRDSSVHYEATGSLPGRRVQVCQGPKAGHLTQLKLHGTTTEVREKQEKRREFLKCKDTRHVFLEIFVKRFGRGPHAWHACLCSFQVLSAWCNR